MLHFRGIYLEDGYYYNFVEPIDNLSNTLLDSMPEFFEEALNNKEYKKMVLMDFIEKDINVHELDAETLIRATYALVDFKYQLIDFLVPAIFEHYESEVAELNANKRNRWFLSGSS